MPRHIDRRAFLTSGALATAGLAVARARPAGAATELAVYRLSADGGYPVGPKGKTRCACKACHRRAENAFFETRDAAIAGRIHPGCVCQPYRATVPGVAAGQLFVDGSSADLRDPRVAAVMSGAAAPTTDPTTGSIGAGSSASAAALRFARTGTTLRLAEIGAGALAVGAALLAIRTRRSPLSTVASDRSPEDADPT